MSVLSRVAVCVFFCLALMAQTDRGNVAGVVLDTSGAAVPGAQVSIVNKGTNTPLRVETTSAGEYNAPNLPPGEYRVEVVAQGFKRFVQENVTVTAAGSVRIDATLQLGQVSETVEVTDAAAQIQTENAKITTAVQNKLVDELPVVVGGEMRSPFTLVSITAEARGSGTRLALGGGQARSWNATMDGLSIATNRAADATEIAYTAPSLEAITEFAVDTNGFKAEYGQAGGGIMTFVSKSGTNEFHGNAYEFLRNEALDARGFFAPRKAVYKQHDFGATFGGPIRIPKLYDGRNRSFFFVSYEGFRNRVGSTDAIFSVPTPEMYQGDFSNWVNAAGARLTVYDPATTRPNPSGTGQIRDAFPMNQVPSARFSSFARSVIPFAQGVTPNVPGLVPGTSAYVRQNFRATGGALLTPTDKASFKVDQNLGSAQRLGFFMNTSKYRRQLGAGGTPGLPEPLWQGQLQQFDTESYRLTHDWTLSPTILNHFSIGGNKFLKNSFSSNAGKDWADKICLKNAVDCNVNFPRLTFSEFSQWGDVAYNGTEQPMFALKNDFSLIRGSHSLKFGYQYDDQRANGFGQQDIMGAAGFSFLQTGVPGVTTFNSGSSFASFLLGEANSGNTETIRAVTQFYRYHGLYVQDDWRLSRKLTLNIGLRWDYTSPPFSATDEFSDFTPDRPNPAVNNYPGALRFAGFGDGRENTRSLVNAWYGGWGQRIGIAYAVSPKTTVRSAFGRSFSRVTAVGSSGHYAGFIGIYSFASPNQIAPAFRTDEGLPPYILPPNLTPSFSNNQNVDHWQVNDAARASANNYWTLSVQRQVSQNMVFEAAYNANVGTQLQAGLVNLNQVPTPIYNDLVTRYGATEANAILRAQITAPNVQAAGIRPPYENFTNPAVQLNRTANQGLRPHPQYLNIVTGSQGGDKSGHSAYHAMVLKLDRRFASGLTFQWNYTLSKLLTDADSYGVEGSGSMDQYNRRLEKSIGSNDQTHAGKFSTVYELPFGRGRKWLTTNRVADAFLGGWRVGAIQTYVRGYPVAVSRNNPLPIFNSFTRPQVNGYDNWRGELQGDRFDPAVDNFFNRSVFPTQTATFGNATRFNPKLRELPFLSENVSLAKTFRLTESIRLDFRAEAFNLFNRTRFGTGNANLDSNVFGVVASQANDPRQMQMALKLYF